MNKHKELGRVSPPIYPALETFRKEIFFDNIMTKNAKGLEIGAFQRPTVPDMDVKYLDCFSTDELKKYVLEHNFEDKYVVNVDYVVKDNCYDKYIDEKFDFIIANHVMEHIPNPIKWLKTLENMLHNDGYLFIVLPDKKYNFDKFRTDTDFTHLIVDYIEDTQEITNQDTLNAAIYYDKNYISESNNLKALLNLDKLKEILKNKSQGLHAHVFQAETFLDKIIKPILYTQILNLHIVDYTISHQFGEFVIIFQKGLKELEINENKILEIAADTVNIVKDKQPKMQLIQNIFSIKNEYTNKKIYKVLTIFYFKFKFRNSKKELARKKIKKESAK